ncbi:hypothetical protein GGD61_007164 [Bradyrhizobium sp. SBR1B]|nr:hypothetical protein [Bradyrhizobium sp. SBR1B]
MKTSAPSCTDEATTAPGMLSSRPRQPTKFNPNRPRRSNSRLPGTSDPIGLVSKRQSGPSCHSWPPYPLPPEKCSTPALKESALALNR